jgi:putative inorganic carbon (HCO3(-)) transporter
MLGLPGLRSNGFVNLNALAGTALLIGPVSAALAIAYRRRAQGRTFLAAAGWAGAALALFVIFFSQSRSAWLASVVLGFVLAVRLCARWVRPWTVAIVFIGLLLGSAAVVRAAWPQTYDRVASTALYSGDKRLAIYRQALHHVRTAPLLGIGLNEFRNVYEPPIEGRRRARPAAHAHNIFLQTALDIGLIGLAAYCGLLVILFRRAYQASRGPRAASAVLAAGGGIAIAAGFLFGIADALALGAKVGIFQWLASGLILAAATLQKGSGSQT